MLGHLGRMLHAPNGNKAIEIIHEHNHAFASLGIEPGASQLWMNDQTLNQRKYRRHIQQGIATTKSQSCNQV